MNCIVCGRATLRGGVIHEVCKRIPVEEDDAEIERRRKLVENQRNLCEEITALLNSRSALRGIDKKR